VPQSEIDEMNEKYEVETIANHFQVLRVSNNDCYYLNPELVPDTNSIVLCPKCFMSPLQHPYSIARGHDYGIISSLPELSKPSQNSISLMRLFGWTVHINDKTSRGHCISYSSDGPSVCASKILPAIDNNYSPQVTFIGTKEQWRVDRKNYKNVCHISANDVFDRLKVMCDCNELFIEKTISIDHSNKAIESIEQHNKEMDEAVIVTLDRNIHAIALEKNR